MCPAAKKKDRLSGRGKMRGDADEMFFELKCVDISKRI